MSTPGRSEAVAHIDVPSLDPAFDEVWQTLLTLTTVTDATWALIGGQMVLLHALEQGRIPPAISTDGDARRCSCPAARATCAD